MSNTGTGTSGTILQGQGAGATAKYSTATYPSTAGSSGKILISDGSNIVSSTPTYPNTASTALKHIKSDGTNFVTTTVTYPDASVTAGKIIVSDGTNYISSTPTFPNASATTRKIIISDGTNWIASTETYAAPGSSGNILTSDGTNWTSAAASGGSSYALQFGNGATFSAPADSTTYYVAPFGTWVTAISGLMKVYIPKTGTIRQCYGVLSVQGTLGTSENITVAIRLNDTTNTNVTTTLQATAIQNAISNAAVNMAVTAGDYISMMVITPAWSTNPTNVQFNVTLFIS